MLTYFLHKQATPSTVCRRSMLDIPLLLQHNATGGEMLRRSIAVCKGEAIKTRLSMIRLIS